MRSAFLLLTALVLVGCREGSFLQRRYDDFTAHYNTFYNAKRQFDQGVRAIRKQERPIDQERYIPVFLAQQEAVRSPEFEKAITKSANLLREHPRSRWVDNALMLIGKSYFYRQEYVGAEQKFREVIHLGGPLADEARFWLARSLVAAHAFDDAKTLLDESLTLEGLGRRWEASLRLVKGELHVQESDWEAAATELEAGLRSVRDDEVASRAQFLLGQVLETMGRFADAAQAYRDVERFKPLYELSYAAKYSEIRALGLHGQPEKALAQLRRMKRDDKHFSYMPQLEALQARLLTSAGRYDEAFDLYDALLYDPESKAASLRGQLHYGLAELYRDGYQDFFLAAAHFDTAATNLRTNRTSFDLTTPHAITNAREVADIFKSFRSTAERIMRSDSLLALGALDDAAFDSALAAIQEHRVREAERRRAELARRMAENRFRESMGQSARSASAASPQGATAAGFLNHRDADRFQEGVVQFRQVWGDRPRVDNWRRKAAISAALALQAGEHGENPGEAGSADEALTLGLPPLDISEVPRDPEAISAMEADRAAARYELANVLFLQMLMPDSAATWYRLAVDQDEAPDVAQRAYFALAEVQMALSDTTAAHRLYREIVSRYPTSDFAVRSRERLGLPPTETLPDSLTMARSAYDKAYAAWLAGEHDEAFEAMLHLAIDFAKQPAAGQALLAAGLIQTQRALLADADLFEEIPVSEDLLPVIAIPDSTTTENPPQGTVRTDSTAIPVAVEPDSLALAVAVPPGEAAGHTAVPADSSRSAPSSGRPSTTGPAGGAAKAAAGPAVTYVAGIIPRPLTVETLYTSAQTHFPGTPIAERAQGLLKYVADQKAAAEAAAREALAQAKAASDSLAALERGRTMAGEQPDSAAAKPDTALTTRPADSLRIRTEGQATMQAPTDTSAVSPPVDPARPGSVQSSPSADASTPEALRRRREQMLQARGARPSTIDSTRTRREGFDEKRSP